MLTDKTSLSRIKEVKVLLRGVSAESNTLSLLYKARGWRTTQQPHCQSQPVTNSSMAPQIKTLLWNELHILLQQTWVWLPVTSHRFFQRNKSVRAGALLWCLALPCTGVQSMGCPNCPALLGVMQGYTGRDGLCCHWCQRMNTTMPKLCLCVVAAFGKFPSPFWPLHRAKNTAVYLC